METLNSKDDLSEIKFQFWSLLYELMLADHFYQIATWQVLQQEIQVVLVLECIRNVHEVIGVVQFFKDLLLIYDMRYLFTGALNSLLVYLFACEKSLRLQVSN